MDIEQKEYFMKAALIEGKKALPDCRPNPPVGCVIVKNGQIISSGYTNEPGQHHAEAMALANLPDTMDFEGASIFVTLEPCSFYGRTPSCAKSIIKKGIKEIYVGMIDPHPKNNGAGIRILEEAGAKVEVGILREEVEAALEGYLLSKSI